MGSKSSKSHRSEYSSCPGNHPPSYGRPESVYSQSQHNQYTTPQHRYAHSPSPYGRGSLTPHHPRHSLSQRYSRIGDNYYSLDQVTSALAQAGLESSNLIVGIDFTKSNEWTGSRSFNRRSLHHLGNTQNPYEQALSIIGKTLSAFDEDNLIPCYGFGDATTHDKDVFSFYPEDRYCNGFEDALQRYRDIVPNLKLAGPTSFAPIIEMAMTTVEESGGQYHVLLIIADGQVTRSVDTNHGQLSQQEQRTVDAIVRASEYPLSIVLVGVGDGPWDMMREFDDNIPARCFDNFQFVNFTEIMSKNVDISRKHTEFALAALMEIPAQYKATLELNLLGSQTENAPERAPLPPPSSSMGNSSRNFTSGKHHQSASPYSSHDAGVQTSSGRFNQSASRYSSHDAGVQTSSGRFDQSASRYSSHDAGVQTSSGRFDQSASRYSSHDAGVQTSSSRFDQSASPYRSYETGSTTSSDWFQTGTPYSPYEAGYSANSGRFQQGASSYTSHEAGVTTNVSSSGMYDNKQQVCPVCLCSQKDMAFGCGHQTCCQCGEYLSVCPICRGSIYTKIRLY